MWGRRARQAGMWAMLMGCGLAIGLAAHQLSAGWRDANALTSQLTLDVGPQSTLIFDSQDRPTFAVFEEHRVPVRLEEMSEPLIEAVLIAEDRRFFEHDGLDYHRIGGAFVANLQAGRIEQGGSTITQQLVRALVLNREKTYRRKIVEAILARRLESRYSKRAILEAYLNRVYFGSGYYGVEAAARGYFGKPAREIDHAEGALLAALIKGPSIYSPLVAPERARDRRDWVLREMHLRQAIAESDYRAALAQPVRLMLADEAARAASDLRQARGGEYYREAVTQELIRQFGWKRVYTGGLRVFTAYDPDLQRHAEQAIQERLARFRRGDQADPLQGALVAIDPGTGQVKALVGGRDFAESPFNRAVDARRQPGSAFKPFIYAKAIEAGYTPRTLLDNLDEPIMAADGPWLPSGEHEVSAISLHDALVVSSNRAAAHLMQHVGVGPTLDLVQRFGIHSPQPQVPSVALGTGGVSLLELTSAYGVFANRGLWVAPRLIRRVEDPSGRVLWRAADLERQVISDGTAFLMSRMMADVVNRGTAYTARTQGFRLPAAGKTGTSDDYSDAWFVGYTPELVTGVWFGHDRPRPIMRRGFASVVAVPAWAAFMKAATEGHDPGWFEQPDSLVPVEICRLSGQLATDDCRRAHTLPSVRLGTHPLDPAGTVEVTAPGFPMIFSDLMESHRVPEPCLMHDGWMPLSPVAPAPTHLVAPLSTVEGPAPVEAPAPAPASLVGTPVALPVSNPIMPNPSQR